MPLALLVIGGPLAVTLARDSAEEHCILDAAPLQHLVKVIENVMIMRRDHH